MFHLSIFFTTQTDSAFWRGKLKTTATKTNTGPKSKKNKLVVVIKPTTMGESADVDDQSEVELDSLGRVFIQLADTSCSQDEVVTSRADDAEVISISSGSESLSPKKARRVIRKVRFSHPDAQLDTNFILKKT